MKKTSTDFKAMLDATNIDVPKQKIDPVEPQQPVQTTLFPEHEKNALTGEKKRTKDNEVQLNVHVDAKLMKKLKLKGVNENKNIKQMISEAISNYLIK